MAGGEAIYDEVSGVMLDAKVVKVARETELEFIDKKPLHELMRTALAWEVAWKPPISTRWVDINKGNYDNPEYRSKWVARQVKVSETTEFFAATPPWEAVKMLLSMAASQVGYARTGGRKKAGGGRRKRGVQNSQHWVANCKGKDALKLDLLDISRAHFNAKPKGPTYVNLPSERER